MTQIALIGNPNCGKTTLLNALTGAQLRVGNWPGVTVERKQAQLSLGDRAVMLNDLPGVYSLDAYSIEEKVALGYLQSGQPQLILNVVDATNLERNLYLTLQLQALGLPVVVALNLMDAFHAEGGRLDVSALSQLLHMPIVPLSAATGDGLDALKEQLRRSTEQIRGAQPVPEMTHLPFDDFVWQVRTQYRQIEEMLRRAHYSKDAPQQATLDQVALHPIWAYPLFFALMALMFFVTFGPLGGMLTAACEQLVALISIWLRNMLLDSGAADWLRSLVLDGALAGVGGVVCFLPQILLLFGCLSLLEDSGYMARAAYLFDRPLRALGLSGRAFIPMLMGFGCTTTAVIGARGLEDERDRRMTILLLPFMSCSAKLPVYALFGAALFRGQQTLLILSLYLLGMLMMVLIGALLKRTVLRPADAPFLLELPPYRMPRMGSVMRRIRLRALDFLRKAGTLIFLMSILIWLLQSITPQLSWASSAGESLFGRLGGFIAPIFAPLGFGDWRKCMALLSGLVAKEAVVSTLSVLYHAEGAAQLPALLASQFTPASAASYLVFMLLYPVCLSALAAMRRELGSRRLMWLSVGIQLGTAYMAALIVYQVARSLTGG